MKIILGIAATALVSMSGAALAQGGILPDPTRTRNIIDTHLACASQDDLTKAIQLSVDDAAFQSFVKPKIMSLTCIFYEEGTAVYVTQTSPFRGQFKVRRRGDHREFWVYSPALTGR